MNIGENIRKHRIEKDIKANVIYDQLGISQSTYSKIENNKLKIDIYTLSSIAEVLNIDLIQLIKTEKNELASDDQGIHNHTNSLNSNIQKLINSLESQIKLLQEQNNFFLEELKNKNKMIKFLKKTRNQP